MTDRRAIAKRYIARGLTWDAVTTLPWDWCARCGGLVVVVTMLGWSRVCCFAVCVLRVVLTFATPLPPSSSQTKQQRPRFALVILGLNASDSPTARWVSMLRLLRLGRASRLGGWAAALAHDASLSLFWVTIGRNFLALFLTTHLGACGFYLLRVTTEPPETGAGAGGGGGLGGGSGGVAAAALAADHRAHWPHHHYRGAPFGSAALGATWDDARTPFQAYLLSLYWSAVTFYAVGFGDIVAANVAEAAFTTLFIYLNIFVGAMIIGEERRRGGGCLLLCLPQTIA